MSYLTFINLAYWTLATLIVAMLAVVAGLGVRILVLRSRRFKDLNRTRDLRRTLIEGGRDARAFEDACWYLLGQSDAALAQTITDAKAVVRLVRENRRTELSLVQDEAL